MSAFKRWVTVNGCYYANNQYTIYNDYSAHLKQWIRLNTFPIICVCHLLVGHVQCLSSIKRKKKEKLHFSCTLFDKFATRYSQLLATPSLIFWISLLVQCFTNPDLMHQLTQSKQWLRGRVKFYLSRKLAQILALDLNNIKYYRQTLEEMNSSKRSESDWQGLVSEVSDALLKHGGGGGDDDDSCFHMVLHRCQNHLNSSFYTISNVPLSC